MLELLLLSGVRLLGPGVVTIIHVDLIPHNFVFHCIFLCRIIFLKVDYTFYLREVPNSPIAN